MTGRGDQMMPASRLSDRLRDPLGLRYVLLAALGAILASGLAVIADLLTGSPIEAGLLAVLPQPDWANARNQCLVVAGLLLVPASIFPAVVGAMFPQYWRATPQTAVAHDPIRPI